MDRDILPALCTNKDPRFASLLVDLLLRLEGSRSSLCCAPYILAQVRLREQDREKAADSLISDFKQVCLEENWMECSGHPIATSTLHGLEDIASEGNVAVFRRLLGSAGVSRLVALAALNVFHPFDIHHIPAPKTMRQLLPDVTSLYSDENDDVQAAAIRVTPGLASGKKELNEYLNLYSRKQPSPGKSAQISLKTERRFMNEHMHRFTK